MGNRKLPFGYQMRMGEIVRNEPEAKLFRPIGTQCVMGVQSVRAKARRKLKCMSLRLAFLHKDRA